VGSSPTVPTITFDKDGHPMGEQNRRQHVRIYRNFILSCYLKDQSEVKYELSQVNNISQGGVNFSSSKIFPVNSQLVIELRTPLSEKVDLQGLVLECREKVPNLIWEIRVKFETLSAEAKDVLEKIERYAGEQK
jgi:hypothetical protein